MTAERFARQRLRALAKIEGLQNDGKPTVLFLCSCSCGTHDAGRSQLAPGFFEHLTGNARTAQDPRDQAPRRPETGLVARMIAACMPGAASWVNVTSASTNPAAASPFRYSARDSAPAMQPT